MKTKEVKEHFGWDWMKPDRVTIRPEASLEEAIRRMSAYGIHHLLVMEGGELVGLVEARDIPVRGGTASKVEQVMRRGVPAMDERTEIRKAVEQMIAFGCTALPISREGKICGILTETELLRLLHSILEDKKGLGALVEKGEALVSNILTQNLFKMLAEAGF